MEEKLFFLFIFITCTKTPTIHNTLKERERENGREIQIVSVYTISFRKLYESICPARDTFDDLREAIEYIESRTPPNSNTKKPIELLSFFTNHSEYVVMTRKTFDK